MAVCRRGERLLAAGGDHSRAFTPLMDRVCHLAALHGSLAGFDGRLLEVLPVLPVPTVPVLLSILHVLTVLTVRTVLTVPHVLTVLTIPTVLAAVLAVLLAVLQGAFRKYPPRALL
jgi:hypothetical protein